MYLDDTISPSDTMNIIEVKNLRKNYEVPVRREGVKGSVIDLFHRRKRTVEAVKDISFSIAEGEVLGYIGQNGAGKSTTIKMMSGILVPTSGQVQVLGFDPARQRKQYAQHIGVVFGQRTQLWWDIALIESFQLLKQIYRVPENQYRERLDHLVGILNLHELLSTPVRKLSLGQRMRGELAASLLHSPKILFLDEPTIGLDEVGKHSVRSFLKEINKDFSTTIILTTHDLTEIEELCGRVIIIDQGALIFEGTVAKLKSLPGFGRRVILDFSQASPEQSLSTRYGDALHIERQGERRLVCSLDTDKIPALEFVRQVSAEFAVADLAITEPSIEEVVMRIYEQGRELVGNG